MLDIDAEIERVEKALETTESYCLRRDYTKYLKKLIRKKKNAKMDNGLYNKGGESPAKL